MKTAARVLLLAALAVPSSARPLKIERIPAPRPAGPAAATQAPGATIEVVAEQVLVKFSSAATAAQRSAALVPSGGTVIAELPSVGWSVVELPAGAPVSPAIAVLTGRPGIQSVTPHHVYRLTKTPNDSLVNQQYALSQIDAFGGWEYEVGTSNLATVAVIDAGVDPTHQDLSAKTLPLTTPTNFHRFFNPHAAGAASADAPVPACNHGTRVAGVAAASTNNGLDTAGISWGARVLSLRVFDAADCSADCGDNSLFGCATTDASLVNAVAYARTLQNNASLGKIVINLSIGAEGAPCTSTDGTTAAGALSAELLAAAGTTGIPVMIAAGNGGGTIDKPANCAGTGAPNGLIPVGATDAGNVIAPFSAHGPELAAAGVVAPGVKVLAPTPGGGAAQATGTSFSAPHAAGLGALILSAQPGCRGGNCALYVQSVLRASADKIGPGTLGLAGDRLQGESQGAGRINAFKAARLAVNGTLADFAGESKPIAFPNPFRVAEHGNVSFAIPPSLQGAATKIRVYTPAGVLVRELTSLSWDGRNKDGNLVASGVYVFVVDTGSGTGRGRVAVIR